MHGRAPRASRPADGARVAKKGRPRPARAGLVKLRASGVAPVPRTVPRTVQQTKKKKSLAGVHRFGFVFTAGTQDGFSQFVNHFSYLFLRFFADRAQGRLRDGMRG